MSFANVQTESEISSKSLQREFLNRVESDLATTSSAFLLLLLMQLIQRVRERLLSPTFLHVWVLKGLSRIHSQSKNK